MTDLTDYTLAQLKQLQARISKEVTKREIDKKAALLKRLRKLAREEGMELEELLGTEAKVTAQARSSKATKKSQTSTAKNAPLPVKYRNPNNLEQGWSGRGRKPAWFDAWMNNGGSLDALENAAQSKGRKKPITASPASAAPANDNTAALEASSPDVTSEATPNQ
ncbi:histone-like nucleoid-structuring protein [Thauera propionica]|uniref:Histone-like nucleoid-structuring protein n=1 Tax=Thauera propionica TaxID=2019431 RepID=A0A235EUN0_9RHOO|nr:H-NS histone family protein [Thauera propionica]OYD52483.1 histone-like nucleoid-structuring protein [Thauera propionica]